MQVEAPAGRPLTVQLARFASAAEGQRRQDYFEGAPDDPGAPALLIWQAPRALLAAPADTRAPQFAAAARACADAGWPVVPRRPGGRVCPISPGTLQLAISRPVAEGVTIEAGYEEMAGLIEALLAHHGLSGTRTLCAQAFCPGRYDIAVAGRKIAGLAQAWRKHRGAMVAITGASVILDDAPETLADAVNLFYAGFPDAPACLPEAIGSVRGMAGHPVTAEDAIEVLRALV